MFLPLDQILMDLSQDTSLWPLENKIEMKKDLFCLTNKYWFSYYLSLWMQYSYMLFFGIFINIFFILNCLPCCKMFTVQPKLVFYTGAANFYTISFQFLIIHFKEMAYTHPCDGFFSKTPIYIFCECLNTFINAAAHTQRHS